MPAFVAPVDLARKQTIERVREAVLSLPGHYREVVVLCDLQELSYEEAAAALACAVGTVRSRLHRARTLLAAKLSELRESSPRKRRPAAVRATEGFSMNCAEFSDVLLELARNAELDESTRERALAHADACPRCDAELVAARSLTSALRSLASSAAGTGMPARRRGKSAPRIPPALSAPVVDARDASESLGHRRSCWPGGCGIALGCASEAGNFQDCAAVSSPAVRLRLPAFRRKVHKRKLPRESRRRLLMPPLTGAARFGAENIRTASTRPTTFPCRRRTKQLSPTIR